jgi:hypothetical protein
VREVPLTPARARNDIEDRRFEPAAAPHTATGVGLDRRDAQPV